MLDKKKNRKGKITKERSQDAKIPGKSRGF
jgi:hypothetical protein